MKRRISTSSARRIRAGIELYRLRVLRRKQMVAAGSEAEYRAYLYLWLREKGAAREDSLTAEAYRRCVDRQFQLWSREVSRLPESSPRPLPPLGAFE